MHSVHHLTYEDRPVEHDVYLTWAGFDGVHGDSWEAEYIWNGQNLGSGARGLLRVLGKLGTLEPGSRVLIYPDYWTPPMGLAGWWGPYYRSPFGPYGFLLGEVAQARGVTLIYSPYNHEGELHPAHRRKWHFRWRLGEPQEEEYSHYLTWRNYDGTGDPASAVYVWDGREVGQGEAGLGAVTNRIRELPERTKILVYPFYRRKPDASGPMRVMPFYGSEKSKESFDAAVFESHVIVLLSAYNHQGKLHFAHRHLRYDESDN